MLEVLGLLLDMIIAALLAGTIFYSMRLYSSLGSFREHRDDFERVVGKLVSSIGQAEQAMKNLKNTGTQEAQNLEDLIRHAREMADELRMVNEASGNMAKRLEDLAEKNRRIVEGFDARTPYKAPRPGRAGEDDKTPAVPLAAARPVAAGDSAALSAARSPGAATVSRPASAEPETVFPSFFIHDRDFDDDTAASPAASNGKGFVDAFDENLDESDEESPIPPALQSQAERELFQALQKNRRKAAGGGQG